MFNQKKHYPERKCKFCHNPYIPRRKGQIYCSDECRIKGYNKAVYVEKGIEFATNGNAGAFAELCVASDLLKKKFHVFRALSPHSSCDLIALKDGKCLRVEVRSAIKYQNSGKIHFSKKGEYDIICGVLIENGEVQLIYEPDL